MLKTCAGALFLVTFLHEFGLPYLALRNGVRGNDAATIDTMWEISYHWFRASHKTNYGVIAIQVTYFRSAMRDGLRAIWTRMRTCSMMLHEGRNVAWDLVLERFNRKTKQGNPHPTRERLPLWTYLLNGMGWIYDRMRSVIPTFGHGRNMHERETLANRTKIRDTLKSCLGENWKSFTQVKENNPFQDGVAAACNPWEVVAAFAEGGSGIPHWYDHATHHLSRRVS